jgi:hypothetical protein
MRRFPFIALTVAVSLVLLSHARAQEGGEKPDPDFDAAKAVLKQYLDATLKAAEGRNPTPAQVSQKLAAVSKFIHPKTLALIADQEKRKVVTNALAVWHWAKADYWLKAVEVGEARKGPFGSIIVETQEKNWRVEEKGEDGEFEPASYLLAPVKGRWLIVDKRRNESFTDRAIKLGYRDYFEGAAAGAKPDKPVDKKPQADEE